MYFEKAGKENTEITARLAIDTARERGIKYIVVASNEGYTADFFKDCSLNIVCITHSNGFREAGKNEMTVEKKKELQDNDILVYTATHLFAGVERAYRFKFGGIYPGEIMASALRMLGQGVKVCTEIAVMALDAGLIPYGEEIISVAGTGRGADTAIVIKPAHADHVLDTWISEIICKPR
jgi:hypothetical protein